MNTKLWGVLAAMHCAALSCADAQTALITWDVDGINAGSSTVFAGTTAAHISAGNLSLGAGVTASLAGSTFGGTGFNQASFAAAVADQDYLAFTLTPAAGYALTLTSIDYLVGKASTTTTLSAILTSDQTGFTESNALDSYVFSNASPALRSITLTGITSLQNITGSIEFRLYGISSSTDTFRIRSNAGADVTIRGSVTAVPEPAASSAIGGSLILIGVLLRRHRRQVEVRSAKKPAIKAGLPE